MIAVGCDYHPSFQPIGEIVITKHRVSAFTATPTSP
jgi:hypothetical protein